MTQLLYYPYWHSPDHFIFQFVSLLCLRSTLRLNTIHIAVLCTLLYSLDRISLNKKETSAVMSTVSKIINYISYVIFHDYICDFTLNVQNCNVKKPLLSHCSTEVRLDSSKGRKWSLSTARCGRNCTKCFGQVRKTPGRIFMMPSSWSHWKNFGVEESALLLNFLAPCSTKLAKIVLSDNSRPSLTL